MKPDARQHPCQFGFPLVNMQGSLANPNIAIELAKLGDYSRIPPRATGKIDARAVLDAKASGLAAILVTVGHVVGPQDPYSATVADIEDWRAFLDGNSNDFALVKKASTIRECWASKRIGVILGFQNSEMLIGDPSKVATFADMGVRVMQLTYNTANAAGSGCMAEGGLTALGRKFVEAMNESGVLVDLSHANSESLRGAIETSTRPIAISHTACRALADHPRNVSSSDLRLLANAGGVVGIYGMPFLRNAGQPHLADFVEHVELAISTVGEDHVGIGMDGTISEIDDVNAYMGFLAEEVAARRNAGISSTGESQAVALFLPDMTGPSQFQVLADALEARGHRSARIEKLLGGNWSRLLREALRS